MKAKRRPIRKTSGKLSISLPLEMCDWLTAVCKKNSDKRSAVILDALQAYRERARADGPRQDPVTRGLGPYGLADTGVTTALSRSK